jgi:hypothetical protein
MVEQSFTVASISDIWELPTIEQMERCLEELKTGMVLARQTENIMLSMMKEAGQPMDRALDFQVPFTWNDDCKGEYTLRLLGVDDDGEKLQIKFTKPEH